LWQPVDIASLVFFRIAFGAIIVWEVFRFFQQSRISRYYIEPKLFFKYFGFGWVRPLPGDGMYIVFAMLGLLGLLIMVGLYYRISAALFFVAFTYVFLLDQSYYLNHFYLFSLISFLMIFLPAHRELSLDTHWRRLPKSSTGPACGVWLLRAQLGLVYFFAGVAKLNEDWFQGEPLRAWFNERAGVRLVGPLLDEPWVIWMAAYGGILFDLFITPALLWGRTRPYAFVAAVLFHIANAFIFHIGVFPWFMIAATTLFFPPDWPRRYFPFPKRTGVREPMAGPPLSTTMRQGIMGLILVYMTLQVLIPLRHLLYPGNVNWTEEGHRFAWRMKLRDKEAEAQFFVSDSSTNQSFRVDARSYLTPKQYDEMAGRPDMILQFAHHLAEVHRRAGNSNVQVRAFVRVSLNGRPPQLLINPSVDLAAERRSLGTAHWILPLAEAPAR
jgi:vitamin K-dependent gamma-carboxylase